LGLAHGTGPRAGVHGAPLSATSTAASGTTSGDVNLARAAVSDSRTLGRLRRNRADGWRSPVRCAHRQNRAIAAFPSYRVAVDSRGGKRGHVVVGAPEAPSQLSLRVGRRTYPFG
jgi:hypothetical protein